LKLDSEPTANVTIPISSDNVSEGTVSVSSLTFTSVNWNSAQTVTVTGVDDSVVDDNVTYNIVFGPTTSSDVNYDGVDIDDLVIVNINDDIIPNWKGTRQIGTSEKDFGDGLSVDISGNVYVSGYTRGGLEGNSHSGGWDDIFLAKYNSSGIMQWTKQHDAKADDQTSDIITDSSGNIYITGSSFGDFDGHSRIGNYDFILFKYNSNGTKQWSKQIGTKYSDRSQAVAVDSSGNIYMTGYTKGNITLTPDHASLYGEYDIVLFKFNSSGVEQWKKQIGTNSNDYGYGINVDSSDNIYITGAVGGNLGEGAKGGYDLFLIKYNSDGSKLWTKQMGSSLDDKAYGVTSDSSDNLYVTGYTSGGLDGNSNSGGQDLFIVKYNSSGTKQWTKQYGSSSDEEAYEISTGSSENVYITGHTKGDLFSDSSAGFRDIFLIKLDFSGSEQWKKQYVNVSNDYVKGLTIDSLDNLYVSGYTDGGLDENISAGGNDIFLIKFDSEGNKQ